MEKFFAIFWSVATVIFSQIPMPSEPSIHIFPKDIIQGEPAIIIVSGLKNFADLESLSFNGVTIDFFEREGKPTALVGFDIKMKTGDYLVVAKLRLGEELKSSIKIAKREFEERPLGIPTKLGGNTRVSQTNLVNTLAEENKILENVASAEKVYWRKVFIYPLEKPIVTDSYGYSRKTGSYSILHKGTDFSAKIGTPILAMNDGSIVLVREFRNYGKTVIVDHGLGVHTIYMHLSKIEVGEGEIVRQGQRIALSGDSGYAESPHLHLSIKINGVSIDPIKFLGLFQN